MVLRDGRPSLVFGSMGGDAQAQVHAQVLTQIVDDGADPQAAIDAPRWRVEPLDWKLRVETRLGSRLVLVELAARRHEIDRDLGLRPGHGPRPRDRARRPTATRSPPIRGPRAPRSARYQPASTIGLDGRAASTRCATRSSAHDYLPDEGLATSIFLALALQRPLLLEGEAGVGKTEVAKVLARWTGGELVRLQCYEGIDAVAGGLRVGLLPPAAAPAGGRGERRPRSSRTSCTPSGSSSGGRCCARSTTTARSPPVLLVDEVDRADDEFEAFLLEILSDYSVTVPELGEFRAEVPPVVSSRRTAPATCTTRSSAAASTTGSSTPTSSASSRSCG